MNLSRRIARSIKITNFICRLACLLTGWATFLLGCAVVGVRGQQLPLPPPPANNTETGQIANAPAPLLTPAEAVRLALLQASSFQQAQLNEQIAAEDVRQAQIAFLPRLASPSSFIYNSPGS